MQITYLKLVNYSRIKLNHIQSIELDFSDPIQLILGTNGCGKSSILSELTPFPPASEFYSKGGGKTIHISHNNCSYILTTVFNKPSGEHSFIKNGTELNLGSTFTAQKLLVLDEFGISQEVLNLLLGYDKFTKMDSNKRSDWFTKLSEMNYDYPLSVYSKVKEQYRDITGMIRIANKRLAAETSSEIDEKEELKLKDSLDAIYIKITNLYKDKYQLDSDEHGIKKSITETINKLKLLTKEYYSKLQVKPNYLNDYTLEEIKEQVNNLLTEKTKISERLSTYTNQFFELNAKYNQIESFNSQFLESSEITIEHFNKEISIAKKSLTTDYISNVNNITLENFISTMEIINGLIITLPENKDNYYTKKKQQEYEAKKAWTNKEIKLLETENKKLQIEYEHISEDIKKNKLECPSCKHQWINLGIPVRTLEEIKKDINKIEEKLTEYNNTLLEIEKYLNECNEYANICRQIYIALSSNPELNKVKDYILSNNLISSKPHSVIHVLQQVEKEINIKNLLVEKEKALLQLLDINKIKNENSNINILDIKNNKDKLEKDINKLNLEYKQVDSKYNICKSYYISLVDIEKITSNINANMHKLSELIKSLTRAYKNSMLQNEIETCREEAVNLSKRLDSIVRRNTVIKDIQEEININKKKEEHLKLLLKHLNPNDGLIADSLFGFIKVFLASMNSVLSKIWTYPMEILICKNQEDDSIVLDYKFPIVTNNDYDHPIKDISKGSEGIQEIINFAFRITALSFLKIVNYPLYLDEFGSNFDPTHKPIAMNMVKELMENESFPQLFLISHYSECHEIFSNAEVCLLCDKNIQLENSKLQLKVNHHVKIEKK